MRLDIITPVGPGHETLIQEAILSLDIAKLHPGPFDSIQMIAVEDFQGLNGRSKSRNHGIRKSKSDWLFFLDADDLLHPEAFKNMNDFMKYDCVWGQITEYREGCYLPRYQVPKIENIKVLYDVDPYLTLQMGFFVRRDKMIPFDESLDCGEDWDVYLKLWKSFKCIKQPKPFMINRRGFHSQGPKSADGGQWRESVTRIIKESRVGRG